jgi:hypothetical protein
MQAEDNIRQFFEFINEQETQIKNSIVKLEDGLKKVREEEACKGQSKNIYSAKAQ